MVKLFRPRNKNKENNGQVSLPGILSMVILVFLIFTVGRVLFNAGPLDPDSSDGVQVINGVAVGTANPLTNIGFVVMSGIILIAAMAGIAIRFF